MSITANSGRSLYDGGTPLPGQVIANDRGEHIIAGVVAGDMPFGRLVGNYTLQSDGKTKLFAPLDETTVLSDGISAYSFDAIAAQDDLKYSDEEACGIVAQGLVVVETDEELELDDTALTVNNGDASGQSANVGKFSNTTGAGHSSVTNCRLVERLSSTLAVIRITGPVTLVALS